VGVCLSPQVSCQTVYTRADNEDGELCDPQIISQMAMAPAHFTSPPVATTCASNLSVGVNDAAGVCVASPVLSGGGDQRSGMSPVQAKQVCSFTGSVCAVCMRA
jgi:hypothetical protein